MNFYIMNEQCNIFSEVLDGLCEYGLFSNMKDGFTKEYLNKFLCDSFYYFNRFGLGLGVDIKYGSTKAVICLSNNDWVLKIPFTNFKIDYCNLEETNYCAAKREGFEDFMAETHYLMDFKGIPCYIMRKAEVGLNFLREDMYSCLIKEGNSEEYAVYNSELNCSDEEYVEDLLGFHYDHKRLDDFLDFCSENEINDIHTDNVGYIDGRLVVIDYSGYHG